MKSNNTVIQMRKGLLELCILCLLQDQKSYATELLQALKDKNMIVVEGTLYPLLNRMMREGYLRYEWRESVSGPPRKYYELTDSGKGLMHEMKGCWHDLSESVASIIKF